MQALEKVPDRKQILALQTELYVRSRERSERCLAASGGCQCGTLALARQDRHCTDRGADQEQEDDDEDEPTHYAYPPRRWLNVESPESERVRRNTDKGYL